MVKTMFRALRPLDFKTVMGRTTRYTLVGAVCAVASNVVMILGSLAGSNYISLSIIIYLVVTPFGYLLHARFTFGTNRSWRDFFRFIAGVASGVPVYFSLMALFCSGLHLPIAVASLVTTAVLYAWNYASAHWALRCRLPFRLDFPEFWHVR